MEEKRKSNSKSFRFDEDTIADIDSRSAYYRCTKTEYLKFLIKRDCASDYSDETLITYRIDELEKKIDRQKLMLDELGNLFLEFLTVYLSKNALPTSEEIKETEASVENMLCRHLNDFSNGKKTFLENLFDTFFWEEEDEERSELQQKIFEKMILI